MKKINYYGQEIEVPDYAKYVATDSDGEVWWYAEKPTIIGVAWSSKFLSGCGRVRYEQYIKNWRRSLREC